MNGLGTQANTKKALHWLRRADLFGMERAKEYIEKIVAESTQLPQVISKKVDQLGIQEKRLKTIEERLTSLMTENELLRKNSASNGTKDTSVLVKDKKQGPSKFFQVPNENVTMEKKEPVKFFHL